MKSRKTFYFLGAGISFGLGFYSYGTYRFVVLLFLPLFWFWWKTCKDKKKMIVLTMIFLAACFLTAMPITIYFFRNPGALVSRARDVSVFSQPNPFNAFLKSFLLHLGMFNFYGDRNWRHNIAGAPHLFWTTGVLFLIGLIFLIKK